MNEINRQLDHDQKLRQFMNTKAQEKSLKISSKKKKHGQLNEEESIYEVYNNSLNNYENLFNTIRQVTGIEDISEFVKTFNEIEDKNFSLFNYVSEISNEIEYSENEIQTLKDKIELLKKEEEENKEKKQKTIKQMEECLESNKEKNETYINDTREKQNIVDIICENVTEIIKLLVNYKPPPGAEFYLTPSTYVTYTQAKIEKENKLKNQNEQSLENNDEDHTNQDDNKEQESSTVENTANNEEQKSENEDSKTTDNKENKDNENNNENSEIAAENEEKSNENNTKKESSSDEDGSNTTKPITSSDEDVKSGTKLTEEVINLILSRPETNKVKDTVTSKN